MAEPICEDEGLLQEWSPLTQLLQKIPQKIQKGLFPQNLNLTCLDVISDYIVLGTNSNLVYWYSRINGELQRLRLENSHSEVTCVKVVSTIDYMVAAGTNQGSVIVFQIPKVVPECIPDQLKPKKKQIERFTINGLHQGPITCIEWSQNGMKLFSGDKNGVVVFTEIDFSLHVSKSLELINEQFEIVQLSYCQQILLISTVYRSITCDGTNNWKVQQVGTKERKILGKFGATLCRFDHGMVVYACRPGYRLWLANKLGVVQQTLIFKSAIQSTCPKIQLINPVEKKQLNDTNFGKVLQFGDNKLVTFNSEVLYVLHPGAVSVMSVLYNVRKILDLAVNDNEIFILEGERSLLRISPVPDTYELEILQMPLSRKSAFNLDEFASKIKDTAVGSIKKITKDFMIQSERVSPISPPALADDALELPPIAYLSQGAVPSIVSNHVEIEAPVEDNLSNSLRQDGCNHLTESMVGNISSSPLYGQDCHEEVISRPLRKKRIKQKKSRIGPPQVLESESDTTSNGSDDRLTWGIANDLSLSDESAMSQSQSSFSVLRDISSLINQQKEPGKCWEGRVADLMATSECKSQTSLDTCESVSECLMTTSEKFRQEQEKTFARLANQSLLDSFNSEKTDMSISLNLTHSSSTSSKLSGNLQSPSEYSENSSMLSGAKTTDSHYHSTPVELQGLNNSTSQIEESVSMRSTLSSRMSQEGNDRIVKTRVDCTDEVDRPEDITDETFNSLDKLSIKPDFTGNSINPCFACEDKQSCDLDFGIKKLNEFFAQENLDVVNGSDNYSRGQFFDEDVHVNGHQSVKDFDKKDGIGLSAPYLIGEAFSYGPPSGSSLMSLQQPTMEPIPSQASTSQGPKAKLSDFSDHWPQYKSPEPVTSLAASKNFVLCTDVNDRVYCSDLAGLALTWVLLDYKASAVRVSNDGTVVWFMYKNTVFSLANPTQKCPLTGDLEEISSNVLSFAIDKKNNDGWTVNLKGSITHHFDFFSPEGRKEEKVHCSSVVTDVASYDGFVLALTQTNVLLCRSPKENEFKPVKTVDLTVFSFALGPDNLLWTVNDKNKIYFSDDFTNENPKWWQIQISDYIFQNSTATFQNIYSKIKLNNLRTNVNIKNTVCITSNENCVWICDKFSTTIRANKSDFTGYIWNKVFSNKTLVNFRWQTLSGEGVFEDKGHIWLLSTDGNIFCTSPRSSHFQTIPVPCDDEVLCIASSSDTLWVLSENGNIYSRLGLSDINLLGNSWRELRLPQIDNLKLIWVSCGCDVAWGCDIHGRTFITIGSPHHMATNIFDAAWLEVEGRPKGVQFAKVFVGPQFYMVWAIDTKGNLYVREGIFSNYQIGTSWVHVGGIEAVHVSISGTSVWALATNGNVYRRCGISERNYIGDYWKNIPGNFRVITSSFTDELWGITSDNEIMRLSHRVKVLEKGNLNKTKMETHSSKEDVSWEIVE
ncbi:hypothetical protein RUM43_009184 [Polyplax serrata]|uniref:HPS5-like beta-propeller domain-containing protein n=1 Tax=Polyplax serrata TaxID=468196 RepID=A0AAN8PCC6_POLSC